LHQRRFKIHFFWLFNVVVSHDIFIMFRTVVPSVSVYTALWIAACTLTNTGASWLSCQQVSSNKYQHVFFKRHSKTIWGRNNKVDERQPLGILSRGGTIDQLESCTENETVLEQRRAIVIMDGFCHYHSGYFKARIMELFPDVLILPVVSDYLYGFLQKQTNNETQIWDKEDYPPRPRTKEEVQLWLNRCMHEKVNETNNVDTDEATSSPLPIFVGIYCESDSGLEDAEKLRDLLQVSCSDEPIVFSPRRNKHLMQLTVAEKAGLPIAKQKLCTSEDDLRSYAHALLQEQQSPYGIVIKPIRGVGSESVSCKSS
jgi:hypothetical protein